MSFHRMRGKSGKGRAPFNSACLDVDCSLEAFDKLCHFLADAVIVENDDGHSKQGLCNSRG